MSGNGAEALADRLAPVIAELEGAERSGEELRVGGRPFAVLGRDHLEVVLDPAVAAAAQRTPDVTSSPRGPGWVRFRPKVLDIHAFDRARAWLRSAHRGASSRLAARPSCGIRRPPTCPVHGGTAGAPRRIPPATSAASARRSGRGSEADPAGHQCSECAAERPGSEADPAGHQCSECAAELLRDRRPCY